MAELSCGDRLLYSCLPKLCKGSLMAVLVLVFMEDVLYYHSLYPCSCMHMSMYII